MNKLNKFTLTICFSISSVFAQGQYCTAIGPSTTADSNVESASISGEGGTQINYTGCPGLIGLEDQTSQSVTLDAGSSYTLSIQFGTCNGNYSGAGEAWIDYNGNQSFEPNESLGTWTGTPPVAIETFNFTVPPTIISGITRLRIIQEEGGSLPLQPCASFSWGSVVDFSVNLTGGIDCSGYVGNEMSDPRLVAALPYTESYQNDFCYTNINTVYNSPDVFYKIIVNEFMLDYINVSLCGSNFDTYLSIIDLDTIVLFTNDDYSGCGTQSELTFPTNGLDTVFVIVQGWGNEQGDYEIAINDASVSGMAKNTNDLAVYPNPARHSFKINGLTNTSKYSIVDLKGQVLKMGVLTIDNLIDVSEFNSGIYIIQIETDEFKLTLKFNKL